MINHFNTIKRTVLSVKSRMEDDSLSLVAAGVSFYAFLSIFPAIASALSIYGLVADTDDIGDNLSMLSVVIPEDVLSIVKERVTSIASNQESTLTFGLVLGLLLSLWSSNKAMKAVADALNVAYDMEENRNYLRKNLVTMALTLVSSIAVIVSLTVVAILPLVVTRFLSNDIAELTVSALGWGILIVVMFILFLVLYKFAPSRERRTDWRKLVPGAIFSTVMFVITSLLFSFYVTNFGKYDEEYGALGTVVVTLIWLLLGAYIFLIGAEINAQKNTDTK